MADPKVETALAEVHDPWCSADDGSGPCSSLPFCKQAGADEEAAR